MHDVYTGMLRPNSDPFLVTDMGKGLPLFQAGDMVRGGSIFRLQVLERVIFCMTAGIYNSASCVTLL